MSIGVDTDIVGKKEREWQEKQEEAKEDPRKCAPWLLVGALLGVDIVGEGSVVCAAALIDVHDVGPVFHRRNAEERAERQVEVAEVPWVVPGEEYAACNGEEVEATEEENADVHN